MEIRKIAGPVRDFGRITLHLREVMEANGVKRGSLAEAMDVRFEVVDRWYNGELNRIDGEILAKLCYVLDCEVADILKYEKP